MLLAAELGTLAAVDARFIRFKPGITHKAGNRILLDAQGRHPPCMARLPRASFALMLSLLPATAAGIGVLVLGQIPSTRDLTGIALVMAGVALHRAARA